MYDKENEEWRKIMSAFILEYKLKQHKEIIHFQPDSPGATLRATELKPKLDQFLKDKAIDLPFETKGHLRYKVNISAQYDPSDAEQIHKRHPLFFGNMGNHDPKKEKKFVQSSHISIRFIVFNLQIRTAIEKYFAEFLLTTNFGTRQSKGFGSFYIDPKDPNYQPPFDVLKQSLPFFLYFKHKSNNVSDDISVIYNLMKSGINHPRFDDVYFRSFLTQYFHGLNIGNEKHFIKEKFFSPRVRIKSDGLEKRYIRAMLGVAGGVKFYDRERRGNIQFISDTIDRFKSPILFKVVDDYVFIIPTAMPEKELFDSTFYFINTFNSRGRIIENKYPIKTPDHFDLKDFLSKYTKYFNELDRSSAKNIKDALCRKIVNTQPIKIKIHSQ